MIFFVQITIHHGKNGYHGTKQKSTMVTVTMVFLSKLPSTMVPNNEIHCLMTLCLSLFDENNLDEKTMVTMVLFYKGAIGGYFLDCSISIAIGVESF